MRLILGSKSFIRQQALKDMGLSFETIPSDYDESLVTEKTPSKRAHILSQKKAEVVGSQNPDAVVIASDAFVHREEELFEKPKDLEDARRMLKSLSNTSFEFVAGLSVYHKASDTLLSDVDSCTIQFRELEDKEIDQYISKHPVLKCAGAFDVAGALSFSKTVSGSPIITSGMSLSRLCQYLQHFGVYPFK